MSITINPADTQLSSYTKYSREKPVTTDVQLLEGSVSPEISSRVKEIFQSSFTGDLGASSRIYASSNSFVRTVIDAYNQHHHLVIRPDDVWLAILTQFNRYVNAHSEELRHLFVAHEGKKQLTVIAGGNRYNVDFGQMAMTMGKLIEENVVDPELRAWIIPDFTTTETNDRIVASVVMMATVKAYFDYAFSLICGLPAVTLLGKKADWEKLLTRIEKLKTFGKETTEWYDVLRPVLSRFVSSFDDPKGQETKCFWQKVAHYAGGGSGPTYLSGWITAFCFFKEDGKLLNRRSDGKAQSEEYIAGGMISTMGMVGGDEEAVLKLDGILYHKIDTSDIPPGYAEVDVLLDDNGEQFQTVMVAGLVGVRVRDSGLAESVEEKSEGRTAGHNGNLKMAEESIPQDGNDDADQPILENVVDSWTQPIPHDGKNDVVQPVSGWLLFDAAEAKDPHQSLEDMIDDLEARIDALN